MIALGLIVAACSPEPSRNEVDIASAARAAQGSVDNQGAVDDAGLRAQRRSFVAVPRTPDVQAPAPTTQPTDRVPLAPPPQDDMRDAAQAVRTYYALIGERRYRDAWLLWQGGGTASGMSLADFAASFAPYRVYRAEVGPPGPIDAGPDAAAVPVKVYCTLSRGTPCAMEGPLTLHRVGDTDTASHADRHWRIVASAVRPVPPAAPTTRPATAPDGR